MTFPCTLQKEKQLRNNNIKEHGSTCLTAIYEGFQILNGQEH